MMSEKGTNVCKAHKSNNGAGWRQGERGSAKAERGWWEDEWKHEGSHADSHSDISSVISGDIYQCHLALLVVSTLSFKNSIIPSTASSLRPSASALVHPSIRPFRHSNLHPGLARSDSARWWVRRWEMEGEGTPWETGGMQGHAGCAAA